jgi:hypothetical protein
VVCWNCISHPLFPQVIEAKEGLSDEGFGLVCKKLPGDALFQTGSLILNAQGMPIKKQS